MKRKEVKISVVITNCVCAFLWDMNVFLELKYFQVASPDVLLQRIMCVILWNIIAIVWTCRYFKSKK